MKAVTRKLTTAAVCTALAVIMCVMTAYLPLSFMPLYIAAFCIFAAARRAGLPYGLLCALAAVGLMFLMTGLSVKWLAFAIVFAPYGIYAYSVNGLGYTKPKTAVIRALLSIVFFNAVCGALYALIVNAAGIGREGLDIAAWAASVGGYAVFALIATAVLLPLDVILSCMSAVVFKRLQPIDVGRAPGKSTDNAERRDTQDPKKYDDVFGYEIVESSDGASESDTDENKTRPS